MYGISARGLCVLFSRTYARARVQQHQGNAENI